MISELGILVHPGEVTPSWEKALEGTSINLLGIHLLIVVFAVNGNEVKL
jgi:hypothetical protein